MRTGRGPTAAGLSILAVGGAYLVCWTLRTAIYQEIATPAIIDLIFDLDLNLTVASPQEGAALMGRMVLDLPLFVASPFILGCWIYLPFAPLRRGSLHSLQSGMARVILSGILAIAGGGFAYFVAFPLIAGRTTWGAAGGDVDFTRPFDLLFGLVLAFSLLFQVPVIVGFETGR